jgi:dienelactone hydrolase
MASATAFLRHYFRTGSPAIEALGAAYRRGSHDLPATVYRPAGAGGRLPAWLVLHGLTYRGREHLALDRFARALAGAGNVVYVPDIPEWRRLRVDTDVTVRSLEAALTALRQRAEVVPERIGLLGFSFGATQGLVAAREPAIRERLAGIAAWGGYFDIHAALRFNMTGEFELDGTRYSQEPDPYGRWIFAANFLTRVPGYEDAGDVAERLGRLATEAGRQGAYAWEPVYDPFKRSFRAELPAGKRPLFDAFAPVGGGHGADLATLAALGTALGDAALAADPSLDPRPHLARLDVPVLLAHGRDDRLIPFTETLRLSRALGRPHTCAVTSLFAHSGGTRNGLGAATRVTEAVRFVRLLRRILHLI